VEALRAAARAATALAGHETATRLLRRALAEPPTPDDLPAVLGELALAAVRAGDEAAVPAVRAAIDVASGAEDRAQLWLALSRTHYQRGEMADAAQAADHGLAAVDGEAGLESLALELRAAWNASTVWTAGGSAAVAERFGDVVQGDGPGRNQGERELLAWLAGSELFRGVDRERALALARRAWADGAYLLDGTGDAARMGPMTSTMLRAGSIEEAILVLDALVDDARRHASPFAHATWRTTRGTGLLYLGRLAEAEVDLEHALEARALGWEATAPMAVESLVSVYLEQDRIDAAAALLETIGPLEDTHAQGAMLASLLTARGRHAFATGDAQTAKDHLLAAGVRVREFLGTDNPALIPWRSEVALAARQLGDLEEATTYAREELDAARRWGAPRTLAKALWTQGVIVGGAKGVALAAQGARVAEEGGVVLEQARALGTQGALLRAGRRRSEAQELLRQALDIAAEHGAHALVRGLREELLAAGGRPRRTRTQGPDALTAGERRVALLAADGLTNRQIADALFVTPKAVGFHLGNVYRKLKIRGREQLAGALDDAG
ncbi:MAG: LuxR C-terminal-related transcriptional regulator, partial [Solirubrobacteraceae bacterium]|nr:LuxR C-terminal-related transcriptional regulator [Solirubrobacteraceae bacterium]